jgi:hypothetical protein
MVKFGFGEERGKETMQISAIERDVFQLKFKKFSTPLNTTSVPEPGVVLGLATVGGILLRNRKKQKTA